MPDTAVTVHAPQRLLRYNMLDLADSGFVAVNTVLFRHFGVEITNVQRLWVVVQGECQAVVEPVDPFDDPFLGEGVGRMAVIAGCNRLVR